jgi:hypothetical protein
MMGLVLYAHTVEELIDQYFAGIVRKFQDVAIPKSISHWLTDEIRPDSQMTHSLLVHGSPR